MEEFSIAKKRYRIGAHLVDLFVFLVLLIITGIFFGEGLEEELGFQINGLPAFCIILFGFFLWPISEVIWGQTLGKRLFNLKVVTDDYRPITTKQAFGRFFLLFLIKYF